MLELLLTPEHLATRTQAAVCTTGAITEFGWTVLQHTPYHLHFVVSNFYQFG